LTLFPVSIPLGMDKLRIRYIPIVPSILTHDVLIIAGIVIVIELIASFFPA